MHSILYLLVLVSHGWGKALLSDSSLKNGFSMERTFPVNIGRPAFLRCIAAKPMINMKSCSFVTPKGQQLRLDLNSGKVTDDYGYRMTGYAAVGDNSRRVCQLNITTAGNETLGQWGCKLETSNDFPTFEAGGISMLTAKQGYVRDVRLPRHVLPSAYDLYLTPFIIENNYTIDGYVSIDATVDLKNVENAYYRQVIVLHTFNTEITSVSVKRFGVDLEVEGVGYDLDRHFLMIFTKNPLRNGPITISIKFISELTDDLVGFYRSQYIDDLTNTTKTIATTQFQSTDARKAFPCFDEPDMKAKFTVHLGRTPDMITLSNMELASTLDLGTGYVMDNYKTSVLMPTSLLAFIVCEFKSIQAEGAVDFKIWARPDRIKHLNFAADIGPKILAYYEELYDMKFPLKKMDMVAIPDFQWGGMENWGLVTYRDSALFYNDEEFTQANRQRVALIVAHELAHQWFGNLVTMKWWNDIWLNEGFASYVEFLGADYVAPDMGLRDIRVNMEMQDVFYLDALPSSHPISVKVENPPFDEIFDKISYQKGSSLIRMMENFLTTETFLAGLRKYFVDHKYSNAEQDDLWEALGTFWSSKGVTLKQVMDSWTTQKGYPVVNVRIVDDYTWELEQHKFNLELDLCEDMDSLWLVPVRYQRVGSPNKDAPLYWFTEPTAFVKSDVNLKENTFIFNIDQVGYYRVNYDPSYWRRIGKAYNQLSRLNRAQVIDDSLNLARAGQLNYTVALDIFQQIRSEVEYVPLMVAESSFTFLDRMIRNSGDKQKYEDMRAVLRDLLTKAYIEVEATADSSETLDIQRKALIMKWACYLGVEACRYQVKQKFQTWKASPNPESSMDPNEKEWVYCNGIRTGIARDWDLAYDRLMKTKDIPERLALIKALACTEDKNLLTKYLNKSIDPASTIRTQDKTYMYEAIGKGDAEGGRTMLQWLEENFDDIKLFYKDQFIFNVKDMLSGFPEEASTVEDKARLEAFLDLHRAELGSSVSTIEEGLDKISANIKWRNNFFKDATEWFSAHVPTDPKPVSDVGDPANSLMTFATLLLKLLSANQ